VAGRGRRPAVFRPTLNWFSSDACLDAMLYEEEDEVSCLYIINNNNNNGDNFEGSVMRRESLQDRIMTFKHASPVHVRRQ